MQLQKYFVSAPEQTERKRGESGSVRERQIREGGREGGAERDIPAAMLAQAEKVL